MSLDRTAPEVQETSTERCWLTEPARKTVLTHVVEVRGDQFRLDRSIYCPRTSAYRHPQDPDRGTVWLPNGEKRRLVSVSERGGKLWHRLRDAVPQLGDRLNCHLDVERRQRTARTHTAMHLVIDALATARAPALAHSEVKGGGTFRLELASPWVDRKQVELWFQEATKRVAADVPLRWGHVPRDGAKHEVRPVLWEDGVTIPGPEHTLDVIYVGDAAQGLPCDGTLTQRTGEVGSLRLTHAHPGKGGRFVVIGKTG